MSPHAGAGPGGVEPARPFDPRELEAQQQLRDAIRGLPWKQRSAVQLFYLEGLSAQHITELLGMPLRTL